MKTKSIFTLCLILVAAVWVIITPANATATSALPIATLNTYVPSQIVQVPQAIVVQPLVPLPIFHQWLAVAQCEEGGDWTLEGSRASGALGILNYNWSANAPASFPKNASQATPMQQVYVAIIINKGAQIPDQGGCGPGW